jgi:hypothetical protein
MSDKAVLIVLIYMALSFGFGILVGKSILWGRTGSTKYRGDDDEW